MLIHITDLTLRWRILSGLFACCLSFAAAAFNVELRIIFEAPVQNVEVRSSILVQVDGSFISYFQPVRFFYRKASLKSDEARRKSWAVPSKQASTFEEDAGQQAKVVNEKDCIILLQTSANWSQLLWKQLIPCWRKAFAFYCRIFDSACLDVTVLIKMNNVSGKDNVVLFRLTNSPYNIPREAERLSAGYDVFWSKGRTKLVQHCKCYLKIGAHEYIFCSDEQ